MSGLILDASGPREALLSGRHNDAGGLASWTSDLVRAALTTVGLNAEVLTNRSSTSTEWTVEVRVSARAAVLIDVSDQYDAALGHNSIDRLELLAARTWREVTRTAGTGELRPWLGAVRVAGGPVPDALGVQRLEQLVASRVLDTACVVMIDDASDEVRSPSPAMSIESFQSALVGRFLVLSTL